MSVVSTSDNSGMYTFDDADRFLSSIRMLPQSRVGKRLARFGLIVGLIAISFVTLKDFSALLFGSKVFLLNGAASSALLIMLTSGSSHMRKIKTFAAAATVNFLLSLMYVEKYSLSFDFVTLFKSFLLSALYGFVVVKLMEFCGLFSAIESKLNILEDGSK